MNLDVARASSNNKPTNISVYRIYSEKDLYPARCLCVGEAECVLVEAVAVFPVVFPPEWTIWNGQSLLNIHCIYTYIPV